MNPTYIHTLVVAKECQDSDGCISRICKMDAKIPFLMFLLHSNVYGLLRWLKTARKKYSGAHEFHLVNRQTKIIFYSYMAHMEYPYFLERNIRRLDGLFYRYIRMSGRGGKHVSINI